MSCRVLTRTSLNWITSSPVFKQGGRTYATPSHLKTMTKKVVDMLIKSDKVVIFSKTMCSQSELAKGIFNDIKQKYTAVELDRREDGIYIQNHLGIMTGCNLIPRIFIVGQCIGGTSELINLHKCGQLVSLLKRDP